MQFNKPQALGSIKLHDSIKHAKERVNMTISIPMSFPLRIRYAYLPWDQRRVKGMKDCGKGWRNMAVLVFQFSQQAGSIHPDVAHQMPGASILC